MTRKEWGELIKGAVRPFAAYGSAIATWIGLFDVNVTEGKLLIVAGIIVGHIAARSYDKKTEPQAGGE